jgi:hypothetical protein
VGRARPEGRRVRPDPRDPRPPADRRRAGDVLGHVERALLVQVVQGAPAQFGEKAPRDPAGKMLAGIGENAGVVDIGEGYAVTFKVESHNHPSYVEPYQGAATGVGGIVRDILAMGARPVAVMDPLRFGAADHPDTKRVLPGVVAGIGGYGNCLGLPNIGGEVVFDPLPGQPAGQRAVRRRAAHEDLHLAKASGVGNKVILFGARTGGDGIGGVSVLASETFDDGGRQALPASRSATRSWRSCSSSAASSCSRPAWSSASRTSAAPACPARPPSWPAPATAACGSTRHGAAARLLAVARGDPDERVAGAHDGGRHARRTSTRSWRSAPSGTSGHRDRRGHRRRRLVIDWHGEPRSSTCRRAPSPRRPGLRAADRERPTWQDALQADRAETLPRPATGDELRATVLRWPPRPNLCDKSWVTDQYDRYVLGNTVLAQPEDAGVVRVDEETGPRRRALHRRQRPVRQARPVRGRAARAGRGVPQRRRHRRHARSRSPTASTSARPRTRR